MRRTRNAMEITKVRPLAAELMPLSCLRMGAQLAQIAFLSCTGGVLCVLREIRRENATNHFTSAPHYTYHCGSLKSRIKLVRPLVALRATSMHTVILYNSSIQSNCIKFVILELAQCRYFFVLTCRLNFEVFQLLSHVSMQEQHFLFI